MGRAWPAGHVLPRCAVSNLKSLTDSMYRGNSKSDKEPGQDIVLSLRRTMGTLFKARGTQMAVQQFRSAKHGKALYVNGSLSHRTAGKKTTF